MGTFFANAPIESGGIFGEKEGIVCRFYADGHTSPSEYRPDTALLNRVLAQWRREGIGFAGMAHSHPNGLLTLSVGDMAYAREILRANPQLSSVLFCVAAERGGRWELAFFNEANERRSLPIVERETERGN